MAYILIAAIFINLAALYSLRFTTSLLRPLETVTYLFTSAALTQQTFSIISANMQWILYPKVPSVFWTLELCRVSFVPSIIVWLIYAVIRLEGHVFRQMAVLAWWVVISIGMEHLYRVVGLIEFNGWNIGPMLLKEAVQLGIIFAFVAIFRKMLKAEGILHAASPTVRYE